MRSLEKRDLIGYLSLVLMLAALYMVFIYAPTDRNLGDVQRIFYFHVSSAWIAFLAFFLVFLASILYLKEGTRKWDILAYGSAEIGVILTSLVLITGSIWAKPIWYTWWTWDARLTTTLVLWLIYVAYLMLRSYTEGSRGARFAAVFAILGFVDVPIVFMSIRWWRTQHPGPVIGGGKGAGLAPPMLYTLFVCLAAFTLLFIYLLLLRTKLETIKDEIDHLKRGD
ncbi:MAG: cytochrome c biogenesis protein [bacterium]